MNPLNLPASSNSDTGSTGDRVFTCGLQFREHQLNYTKSVACDCVHIPTTGKKLGKRGGPLIVRLTNQETIICRCGQSKTFPLCATPEECANHIDDPARFGPLAVSQKQLGVSKVQVCGCGHARGRRFAGRPWCDGTHNTLADIEDTIKLNTNEQPTLQPHDCKQDSGSESHFSLSKENILDFKTKGFVVLKDVLPQGVLDRAKKAINLHLSSLLIRKRDLDGFRNTMLRPTGNKLLYEVSHPDVMACQTETDMLAIVKSFLGDTLPGIPTSTQLALRFPLPDEVPEEEREIPANHWHVDDLYDSKLPPFSLLVGVPLSSWSHDWVGNFTLFEKSHIQLNEMIRSDYHKLVGSLGFPGTHPCLQNPLQVRAEPGDLLLVHPLVAHRAGPNYSPEIRYALYFRFTNRIKLEGHNKNATEDIIENMWREFAPAFSDDQHKIK